MSIIEDASDWQAAKQQVAIDQQKIAKLTQDLALDEEHIAELLKVEEDNTASIMRLTTQLAQLESAFPNLQILDGYERNPIVTDVNNSALSVWSPRTGKNIGGEPPAKYSAQMVNGQFVMSVTGIPPTKNPDGTTTQHWCDVLWANKRPIFPDSVKQFALDFGITTDANAAAVQCLEFDTLCIQDAMEYNLSAQIAYGSGKLQIASGANKGGWIDSGVVVGKLAPGRHQVRWIYGIDRAAKTCQYTAFILDGVRHDIDPAVGMQPAYPQPTWLRNLVILQLQQDVNATGGSYVTTFDNIRYLWVSA